MQCLYCFTPIITSVTWSNVFYPSSFQHFCSNCLEQLSMIEKPICPRCGRPSNNLCIDCHRWEERPDYANVLKMNRSIFSYSNFVQELITQWKYQGDYELIKGFAPFIRKAFSANFGQLAKSLTIIPIPLTHMRAYERAFNQAQAIAQIIANAYKIPIIDALKRNEEITEKQSKKSRYERLETKNPFFLSQKLHTNVLIVDDIYTTGMTIHHAAKQLKKAGSPSIYSFTLAR
ncbi:amidophosphoribosyltransferase [Gracilibacillus halophilus]|nr:amidophosphoribosyltransferase [Gracilibacillus halophilus]